MMKEKKSQSKMSIEQRIKIARATMKRAGYTDEQIDKFIAEAFYERES